jgi:NADPH-dependent curcumin reductase CurA
VCCVGTGMTLHLLLCAVASAAFSNERVVLRSRPKNTFRANNLELVSEEQDPSSLADGEVIVAVDTLSIEAFYRTTLDAEAYHGSTAIGAVVPALGYGEVVASNCKKLKVGSRVTGMLGAQQFARVPAKGLQPATSLPGTRASDCLGRTGLSGLSAYIGMACVLGPPKRRQVVVVSAAAGGVGSLAAQIAKARGALVIGVAGGATKRAYLLETLQLDGAVDYRSDEPMGAQFDRLLKELDAEGIDFFFDNVGGAVLDVVLERLRPKARVVICGGASHYAAGHQNKDSVVGPSSYLKLAERGATMKGFNVMFYLPGKLPAFLWKTLRLIWRGKLRMDEHVSQGLRSFPRAMEMMFDGSAPPGKLLVNVSAAVPASA